MAKKAQAPKGAQLLDNWNVLNAALMKLKEGDVEALLEHEKSNRNRLSFTLRLHQRLSRLRRERERRGLAASAGRG